MAHFAKLDVNNLVLEVHCVHNNELIDENSIEQEQKGIDFLISWSGGYTRWKQTSYNGNFRKNYAGIGFTYRADIDAFVSPQPFPSWLLNANAQWRAPVPMPEGGQRYRWDEDALNWVQV
jgi:hypothetical protein